MQVEWIGTGSGLNFTLSNISFIIRNKQKVILVDCGFTVPQKLLEKKYFSDITDVILTHLHSDHVGGIESFSFMNYFALGKRDDKRPTLHLATDSFLDNLWEHTLSGGMLNSQTENGEPKDAKLEDYFKISIGKNINIDELEIAFFKTTHVLGLESYGIIISNKVYYSGDSVDVPPLESELIFQDCQFFETSSDVHVPYNKLKREIPKEKRGNIWLVHLGGGWDKEDPRKDGFAGFVKPGQIFEI